MLCGQSCAWLGDSRGLSGLGASQSTLPGTLRALEVQGKAAGGPGDVGAPCSPWMDMNMELRIGSVSLSNPASGMGEAGTCSVPLVQSLAKPY